MVNDINFCPECGARVGKGSTHCMNCGARLVSEDEIRDKSSATPGESTHLNPELEELKAKMTDMLGDGGAHKPATERSADDELDVLPPLEESDLEPLEEVSNPDHPVQGVTETTEEGLSWEVDDIPSAKEINGHADSESLTWEQPEMKTITPDEVKVGNPFIEVAPPEVVEVEVPCDSSIRETREHLFPRGECEDTTETVAHLFPEGRGVTSKDFIDVVVGTPERIGIEEPMKELKTPSCPHCGASITGDGFEYPDYVFEAMGKARIERGEELLETNEHEKAIEYFEMAKKLFERANYDKAVEDARKKVDEGYEAMAEYHYDQAEEHKKEHEFEWAIVQYKKAREIYMFTTNAKMRGKCAEKVRECYSDWGKDIEEEGDDMAKKGLSRDALALYQEAAEKFRLGDDQKRLRDLEKKIRKA
jgi:hypothetical protein